MNKSIFIILGAILLALTAYLSMKKTDQSLQNSWIPSQVVEQFNQWKLENNKQYSSQVEEMYRMGIFYSNWAMIQWSNMQGYSWTLGVNQFTDLTNEEFKSQYLGLKPESVEEAIDDSMVPENAVDWRTKGAVQRVKNQGQCGSCWAFSAVAALESVSQIKKGSLGDFSEQQLVDCSRSYGNQGCNGGLMDYAFKYVKDNGITTESAYPYVARDQTCKTKTGAFKITGYKDVPKQCSALQSAVAGQPIAVGVDAATWSSYKGGIFKNCGQQLDHGVLLVGYDDSGNWIIKNSWGTGWGEQGYIRLATGNTCGVCNTASFPNV